MEVDGCTSGERMNRGDGCDRVARAFEVETAAERRDRAECQPAVVVLHVENTSENCWFLCAGDGFSGEFECPMSAEEAVFPYFVVDAVGGNAALFAEPFELKGCVVTFALEVEIPGADALWSATYHVRHAPRLRELIGRGELERGFAVEGAGSPRFWGLATAASIFGQVVDRIRRRFHLPAVFFQRLLDNLWEGRCGDHQGIGIVKNDAYR